MPIKPTSKIARKSFANKPQRSEPLYQSKQWKLLRFQVLRNYPICNDCKRQPSTVADHIKPVRLGGDFWDIENLQGLCASCHNKKSANEARIK
jgi:5-methylcytosine-specific restriction protein A